MADGPRTIASTMLLHEAAEFRLGWSSSASPSGEFPMVRVGDLAGKIDWARVLPSETTPANVDEYLLQDGDVLLARSGVGSVGNVQVVASPPRAIFASYILRIR